MCRPDDVDSKLVDVGFAQRLRPYSSINPRSGQCLFDGRFTAGIRQPSTEKLI